MRKIGIKGIVIQRMSREKNILIFLIRVLPIIGIVIPIIGCILLVITLHRSDFFIKGLVLIIPLTLGSIIILLYSRKLLSSVASELDSDIHLNKYIYYLIFLLLYLFSILICLLSTSILLIYFFIIAIMSLFILIEIVFTNSGEINVLSKIILLLANLIFSQTLRLPYYFGATDLIFHINYVNSIVVFHHVTFLMGEYQYFPLYHILIACYQIVTNMYLRTSFFILTGLIFLSTIYFIYLLSYKITLNTRQSLLATFLYSVSYETIYAGMYMVTRVMSFVFFLVLLYLLIANQSKNLRYFILAIGLILPFIYLHQVSLLQETIIIYALIIIEWFIYLRSKTISYLFPLLFSICFFGYWIYTAGPFFNSVLRSMKSTTDVVNIPNVQNYAIYKYFNLNLDLSILAFFIIIGIIALLIKGYKNEKNVLIVQCAIISLLSLPLILPGPASFLSSLLLTYRIPLMLSPFTIVAVSDGIITLLFFKDHNKYFNIAKYTLTITIIFIFILTSILKIANANDLYLNNIFPPSDRTYYLESEIVSFDFCINKLTKTNKIFTDYESARYISSKGYENVLPDIISFENLDNTKENFFLFRKNHLNERGQLTYFAGETGYMGISEVYTNNDLEKIDLYKKLANSNLIYTNDSVELYDIVGKGRGI